MSAPAPCPASTERCWSEDGLSIKQDQGIAASVKISTERGEVALANPVGSPAGDPNPLGLTSKTLLSIRTTSGERPTDATHLALTKRDAQQ
jgi:hypothetical protein